MGGARWAIQTVQMGRRWLRWPRAVVNHARGDGRMQQLELGMIVHVPDDASPPGRGEEADGCADVALPECSQVCICSRTAISRPVADAAAQTRSIPSGRTLWATGTGGTEGHGGTWRKSTRAGGDQGPDGFLQRPADGLTTAIAHGPGSVAIT